MNTCSNCHWFQSTAAKPFGPATKFGTCHFNPPTGDAIGFPSVVPEDWCSQHKPAQPVAEPEETSVEIVLNGAKCMVPVYISYEQLVREITGADDRTAIPRLRVLYYAPDGSKQEVHPGQTIRMERGTVVRADLPARK